MNRNLSEDRHQSVVDGTHSKTLAGMPVAGPGRGCGKKHLPISQPSQWGRLGSGRCLLRQKARGGTAAPLHASVLLPSFPVCFSVFLSQGSQQQRFMSVSLPNPCPPSACPLELFPGYLVPTILDNLLMPQIDKEELRCWER